MLKFLCLKCLVMQLICVLTQGRASYSMEFEKYTIAEEAKKSVGK